MADHKAKLDKNGKPSLLGVTETGELRRILVDEDGNLLVSGGGGGSVAIFNEDNLVNEQVQKLNFKGAGIQAVQNINDEAEVFIYSPPSTYSSHFNNNDGVTSAVVNNITTFSRNIAAPTTEGTPYKIGNWVAGNKYNSINSTSFSYSTSNAFSILTDDSTIFTAKVFDADGTTILSEHSFTITGNYDQTIQNIRIQITNFATDTDKFKANVTITFNINNILPNGGRFSVFMEHNNAGDGIYTKVQNDVFYDSNNNEATIGSTSFGETIGQVQIKTLSGIKYYTNGSQFTVNINEIDYLNDRSYPDQQVSILGTSYGLSNFSVGKTQLTGWDSSWDNTDCYYQAVNWSLNTNNYFSEATNQFVSSRTLDWVNGPLVNSLARDILVDTFTNNVTRIYEDFRNENERLTTGLSTWTSSTDISSTTDLQVKGSKLVYPVKNYSNYYPDFGNQLDYSSCSGNRYYYRKFWHPTLTFSNGVFTFSGHNLTEQKLSDGDFNIEISNNGTDWYRLDSDYLGGTLSNGDACRINPDTRNLGNNTLEFTLSVFFSTQLYIKITFADTVNGKNLYIDSINLNWA